MTSRPVRRVTAQTARSSPGHRCDGLSSLDGEGARRWADETFLNADVTLNYIRSHPDRIELRDGISFVVVAMGLFGFGEIIANLDQARPTAGWPRQVKNAFPTWDDLRASWRAILRGTGIGAALGVLPGAGAAVGAFAAYTVEKRPSCRRIAPQACPGGCRSTTRTGRRLLGCTARTSRADGTVLYARDVQWDRPVGNGSDAEASASGSAPSFLLSRIVISSDLSRRVSSGSKFPHRRFPIRISRIFSA